MVKSYYYVNFFDVDNGLLRFDQGSFIVDLNGKSFKKVRVQNCVLQTSSHTFNPALHLVTYTGNGFSTDRKSPVIFLFTELNEITGTDYRYTNSSEHPIYHIEPSLRELEFNIIDGTNGLVINPASIGLQMVLELDDE